MKEGNGAILVVYRLYNEYISTITELFEEIQGSTFDFDMNVKAELKGSIIPCKKTFANLKSDFINVYISSTKMKASDLVTLLEKMHVLEKELDDTIFNS